MAADSYNIAKVNFLIIEDNDHMRSLVRNILKALGAQEIREARNVTEALALLAVYPIDIVICDWEMPPVSGIEFVKDVRKKDSQFRFLPIIMLTAHSEVTRVTEARDAGVNEFVMKPISAKTLYTRIREIIRNPREFVETESYFGPDRRRKQQAHRGQDRRAKPSDGAPAGQATAQAVPNG